MTNDDHDIWPECSECGAAYVHRRCLQFSAEGLNWRWLWQQDCKHGRKSTPQPAPVLVTLDGPYDPETFKREGEFIVYAMEDGSLVYGEFSFVTDLEFFDDRDYEIRLVKRVYALVSEETIVLEDPYPIEDEEDDEESDVPGAPDTPAT